MVIDDDPEFRELVEDAFGADFQVTSTPDWVEGVAACYGGGADIVILDLRMPRVDGLAVARALGSREETRRVPVVLVTASDLDVPTRLAIRAQENVRKTVDKLSGMRKIREAVVATAAC